MIGLLGKERVVCIGVLLDRWGGDRRPKERVRAGWLHVWRRGRVRTAIRAGGQRPGRAIGIGRGVGGWGLGSGAAAEQGSKFVGRPRTAARHCRGHATHRRVLCHLMHGRIGRSAEDMDDHRRATDAADALVR